jgi:hypothetical protein
VHMFQVSKPDARIAAWPPRTLPNLEYGNHEARAINLFQKRGIRLK